MSYTLADVKDAKRKILAAFPTARVEDWQDYGWRLTVAAPDLSGAIIVFQPEREEIGQPEVIGTAEAAIGWLASHSRDSIPAAGQEANRIGKDLAKGD